MYFVKNFNINLDDVFNFLWYFSVWIMYIFKEYVFWK